MAYTMGELGAKAYVPPSTTSPDKLVQDSSYNVYKAPVTTSTSVLSTPKSAAVTPTVAPTISYAPTKPVLVALPSPPGSEPVASITPSQLSPSPTFAPVAYDAQPFSVPPVAQSFGGATGGGMSVGGGEGALLASEGGFPWWLIAVAAGVLLLGKKRGR